jgi:RelA/SpoT family (p)ppGpp synthetase
LQKFFDFLKVIDTISSVEEAKSFLFKHSSKFDTYKIQKALDFTIEAHKNQFRKSGEPYVIHPILVASITTFFSDNEDMIISALLHDVVEDTEHSLSDINSIFGNEVEHLVEGLTKIVNIREESLVPSYSDEKLAKSALSFRKMLLSSIKDIRVLVIKLCDRLHNMMTLEALRADKQKRIAEETLLVYAPIAHRLGISALKNELEDLAFKYMMPEEFKKIDEFITAHNESFHIKLNNFIQKIEKLLCQKGVTDFEIKGRIKHYYSVFLKMQRKGISIEEVLDLLAIRVIVHKEIECYETLGAIHLNFRPLISRFKDYIAIPKENGYQTLHSTVFDGSSIIEVQIRTEDMDKNAEFGVAAHWKYKLSSASPDVNWICNLDFGNEKIEDFYELVKNDLFVEDIVVYSPKFDTFTLPREATVLDFAYAIHTDIGNKAIGAFLNKEKTSLLSTLKTGDIVKIVTGDENIPRCSWIDTLKTSKAKYSQRILCAHKIKSIDRKIAISILVSIFGLHKNRVRALVKANNLCEKIYKAAYDEQFLKEVILKLSKTISNRGILKNLFTRYKLKEYIFGNIRVLSNKSISSVDFPFCCHPKMNDDIVGILNKKRVEVHHKLCSNTEKSMFNKDIVFIEWVKDKTNRYFLVVNLQNKQGELAKFVTFLAKLNINILSIELGNSFEDSFCKLEIEIDSDLVDTISNKIDTNYKILEFTSIKDAYNTKVKNGNK